MLPCLAQTCHDWVQSPLSGFRDTDGYRTLFPDRLHQCSKGVGLHIIELTLERLDELGDGLISMVSERLKDSRAFRAHKLSSGIFDGPATASESSFLLKCLPPVLVGIDQQMVNVIAGGPLTWRITSATCCVHHKI